VSRILVDGENKRGKRKREREKEKSGDAREHAAGEIVGSLFELVFSANQWWVHTRNSLSVSKSTNAK
jgi:hypothetical protein